MSTFYTTFLSKSDFSFALFLVTFEPLEIQQSNIPILKALECGINAVGAQGCGCMLTFCHASLKMAILLHKEATVRFDLILAVYGLYMVCINRLALSMCLHAVSVYKKHLYKKRLVEFVENKKR